MDREWSNSNKVIEKVLHMNSQMECSNSLDVLPEQVLRKFQPPFCSFCPDEGHLESLPALLFDCVIVRSFWEYVTTILTKLCPSFKLTKRAALFGDVESPPNSVTNTILLISRVLIWNSKFISKRLDKTAYLCYMNKEVTLIAHILREKKGSSTYRYKLLGTSI